MKSFTASFVMAQEDMDSTKRIFALDAVESANFSRQANGSGAVVVAGQESTPGHTTPKLRKNLAPLAWGEEESQAGLFKPRRFRKKLPTVGKYKHSKMGSRHAAF